MGQYYKGTEATFLDDAMFKAPADLIESIITKKDKEIQTDVDATNALAELLNAQSLKVDEPRLQQKLRDYQDEIDGTVQNILKDPLNYDTQGLQKLRRKLNSDWKTGEIGAIQENRDAYLAWVKEEEAKIKANPDLYEGNQFEALKAKKLAEFAGTNYAGPNQYGQFQGEEVLGMKATLPVLEELMKGAIEDKNSTVKWDSDKGEWNVKGERTEKFFSPKQLQKMYEGYLETNPSYLQAIKQRNQLGLPGWETALTEEGALNFDKGGFFKESMDLLQDKYGGKQTTKSDSKTMNALGLDAAREEADTFNVDTTVKNVYTSYSGKTISQFNENVKTAKATMANTKSRAAQLYLDSLGGIPLSQLTIQQKAQLKQIERGDFSSVANTPEGQTIIKEYKTATNRNAVLNATLIQFKADNPGMDPTNPKDTKAIAQFNDWLMENGKNKEANVNMGYGVTDIVNKDQKKVAEHFFNNGLHMDTKITLPQGFKIKGVDVGGDERTLNDLKNQGFFKVEKKETGRSMDSDFNEIVTYTDGTQIINFTTGKSGVIPVMAKNDSNEIEYQFNVNINGTQVGARASNISTKDVNKVFEGRQGTILSAQRFLNKTPDIILPIPNSNLTYYGRDVIENGKVKRRKGTISDGVTTISVDDEDALFAVGKALGY
jgi:hypothetical protein